jgi:hypothetical protein
LQEKRRRGDYFSDKAYLLETASPALRYVFLAFEQHESHTACIKQVSCAHPMFKFKTLQVLTQFILNWKRGNLFTMQHQSGRRFATTAMFLLAKYMPPRIESELHQHIKLRARCGGGGAPGDV